MHDDHTPLTLLGVPLDLGAANLGVDGGPDAFRAHGIIDKLSKAGMDIQDKGNLQVADRENLQPGDPKLRYAGEIVKVSNEAAAIVESAVREGRKAVVLGGDHSIDLGAVAGAAAGVNGKLGLIYLDAHGDSNTPDITLSGNIHGMHLASLLGYGAPELIDVHRPGAKVTVENLVHIGGSDFDPPELAFMRREHFPMFTLFDLLSNGLAPLLRMIDELCQRVDAVWVSLDLDVIDEVYAPGAAMPNRKGLSYREVSAIAEYIGGHCTVIGMDVAEYNPLNDSGNKTAELGIELIAKFLGRDYSWYTNYMEHNRT